MFIKRSIATALFTCVLFSALQAGAGGQQKENNNRFIVPGMAGDIGARNVQIGQMSFSQMPTEMQTIIQSLLSECVAAKVNTSDISYYFYTSDRNKTYRLPSNILVDFSSLKKKRMKKCSQPLPLCREEQCMLHGYSMFKSGTWENGFQQNIEKWAPYTFRPDQRSTNTTTVLQTTSVNPDCSLQGGQIQHGKCVQNFIWSSERAKIYQ